MRNFALTLFILSLTAGFTGLSAQHAYAQLDDEVISDLERAADEEERARGITQADQESEAEMEEEMAKTQEKIQELVAREEEKRAKAAAAGMTVAEMEAAEGRKSPSFRESAPSVPASGSSGNAGTAGQSGTTGNAATQPKQPAGNMIYIKPTTKTPAKLWNEVR